MVGCCALLVLGPAQDSSGMERLEKPAGSMVVIPTTDRLSTTACFGTSSKGRLTVRRVLLPNTQILSPSPLHLRQDQPREADGIPDCGDQLGARFYFLSVQPDHRDDWRRAKVKALCAA